MSDLSLFGKFLVSLTIYILIVIATIFFSLTSPRDRQEAQIITYENFFGSRPIHPDEAKRRKALEAQQAQLERQKQAQQSRQLKQHEVQPKNNQPANQVRDQIF